MSGPDGKENVPPDLAALAVDRPSAGYQADPIGTMRSHTRAFLQYVDARELRRRISDFRKLNFRDLSYAEVSQAILDVILFDTPNGKMGIIRPSSASYPTGTRFYRVRAIPEDDHVTPLRSMSKVSDCWEPPPEVVPMGRLNREGEPLLYTSLSDPLVAIDELKIADGEWCSVITYEAIEDVKVTVIGGNLDTEELENAEALKLELLQDFLHHEFTRDVGKGTEYLYRISEIIAKHYFDMPPEMHDAWCYPSIADKSKWNVAFHPKDRVRLRLVGVEIARPQRLQDGKLVLNVGMVAKETRGRDDLVYYRIGSPEQRELFPEITRERPADATQVGTG